MFRLAANALTFAFLYALLSDVQMMRVPEIKALHSVLASIFS